MAAWNVYLLLKLLLQWMGYIRLDPVPELLAYALIFALSRRKDWSRPARLALAAGVSLLAAGLLWHESFLPPPEEALRYVVDPALRPSRTYFLRFLKGLFKPWQLLSLGCVAGAAFLLRGRRTVDLTPFVAVCLLLSTAVWRGPDRKRLSAEAEGFYAAESARRAAFPAEASSGPDFDVVIVHVCSLSWSDLWRVGLQRHPFLSQFDILFSSFNVVSSYSEQGVLRLLRAPCGQTRYASLYEDAPPECYLADVLRSRGYSLATAMNHSGEYLEMSRKIVRWGRIEPPMDPSGLPAVKVNFNGSDIHGDYAVLERWWKTRLAGKARRAALYYNTVSLHAGAHPAGLRRAWAEDPALRYRLSAEELFSDLARFFELVRASGRRAVVVFIPEHGGAIQGSQYLVPGMRDLPLPDITLVPVGVKVIGGSPRRTPGGAPEIVSGPTSYLALARLLAGFMERSSFGGAELSRELAELPRTRYVTENKRMVLLADRGSLCLRWMDKKWVSLPRKFRPEEVRTW